MAQILNHSAPGYAMGAGYASARLSKRKKGSSTPGRTKGPNCKADPSMKGMARHNRGYRWDAAAYSRFCTMKDGTKGGGKGTSQSG